MPLWSWTITEGMQRGDDAPLGNATTDPRAALDFIASFEGPAIFHLKDFHEPLRDAASVRRRLRDVYELCIGHAKFVVISSPIRFIPDELYRDILCVEFKVPDSIEVRAFLEERAAAITASGGTVDMSEATVARMTGALLGLTLDEAGFAIQRALADGNRLGVGSLPVLFEEKRLSMNRTGTIEYIADGGESGQRRRARSDEEVAAGATVAVSISRQRWRGYGAERRVGDGRVGMREEPVR